MAYGSINLSSRDVQNVVKRMAYMAEFREGDNSNHLDRIRRYSYILGKGAGLPPNEIEAIAYASQLHDVGKVAIPDEIIKKSGDLTPAEWEIVETHTVLGASILRGSSSMIFQIGEEIAQTHHERWDGSGYPHQIKENDIPISGRICALADVFDALTTSRHYKEESPIEEGIQLILESKGTLFDPVLVDVFQDNIEEILKAREEFL